MDEGMNPDNSLNISVAAAVFFICGFGSLVITRGCSESEQTQREREKTMQMRLETGHVNATTNIIVTVTFQ